MSGTYQDFFKKRHEAGSRKRRPVKANEKIGSQPMWLIIVATVLATGSAWYLFVGDNRAEEFFNRIQIRVLGEAVAEGTGESKTAEGRQKSEEKSAGEQAKDPAKGQANTSAQSKSWTEEEISLFTKLDTRKKQLDAREAELTKLEEELQKQKAELEKKLAALEEVRDSIATKLEDKVKVDSQKVDSLISVYANMKPVQAAKVLESLNEDLAVEVLGKMKNKNAAEILNVMNPDKAKRLSERFAGYREPASKN